MIINLRITYGSTVSDGAGNPSASYAGYGFNTETLSIVAVNGTWRGSLLDNKPADFWAPDGFFIHYTCADDPASNNYTATVYYHVRAAGSGFGTFRTEQQGQSMLCGYFPPPPPSCELLAGPAQVVGTTATIPATGARGVLQYRLNGSAAGQSSNVFTDLPPGPHQVVVVDTGVADCQRAVTFAVERVELPLPSLAPETLHYALRPIFEQVAGLPGTDIELELWVESAHQRGDYAPLYTARKMVLATGVATFRLDTVLREALDMPAPALGVGTSQQLLRPIRHFFCRTCAVDVATGTLGQAVNRPVRSVLLAGLPLPGAFLTTQPRRRTIAPPQYLSYLTAAEPVEALRVRRVVVATDGTRREQLEEVVFAQPGPWLLVQVPVYGAALPPGTRQVEITMLDPQGAALTETRTYELVDASTPRRVFLFTSPAGGIDTLVATGDLVATLEVKPEVAERAPEANDGPRTPLLHAWQLSPDRTRKATTGWLTPGELHWLQCLALSGQAWEVVAGQLEPIVLGKRTVVHSRDERRLEGVNFEYEYAAEEAAWNLLR